MATKKGSKGGKGYPTTKGGGKKGGGKGYPTKKGGGKKK
jgi:hypothetical protein